MRTVDPRIGPCNQDLGELGRCVLPAHDPLQEPHRARPWPRKPEDSANLPITDPEEDR